MVTELITCNVLLPLISRVSDPDWLNQTIGDIFTKSKESSEATVECVPASTLYRNQIQSYSWSTCRSFSSDETGPISLLSDLDDEYSQGSDFKDSSQGSMSSNSWAFSELMAQRKLLGIGALLAWLVLFHLLVNVWLLCIFTSLLVVLGGWLGSRAVLDANSLLHLEHFVPLGKVQPSLHSPEHDRRLDHEIHSAVHKAVRDFVSSWYRTLLPDEEGEFECVVRDSMLESVMELKERACHVDRKALVQRALELYGCHLQSYMTAKEMQAKTVPSQKDEDSLWQFYSKVEAPHPALSSAATELSYSRALVNLILHVLVPYPHMETRSGGYMVTELITCNVLLPLISRVSDPDWLNQTIVDIFTKSKESSEATVEFVPASTLYRNQIQSYSWSTCRSFSSDETGPISLLSDLDDEYSQGSDFKDSSQGSMVSLAGAGKVERCHNGLLTPCRVACLYPESDQDSQSSESKMISRESLIQTDSDDGQAECFCDWASPTNIYGAITFKDDEMSGCFGPLRSLGPKVVVSEDSQWPAGIAHEQPPTYSPRGLNLTPYNFEGPSSPVTRVGVQNLHITGTDIAKEQRGGTCAHPHTLYIIKYETVVDSESLGTLQPVAYHTVSRRYSEFLNLQTRLEEKPELKKLIKNVKGPKKLFPDLSFGNADSDKVETRKGQLDVFLKQLSNIPETANSEDMQEFLAVNTDGCPSFEKKPLAKSRIDKMVVHALDTLKTAFPRSEPQSPTEDLEGDSDGRTADSRKYRRLRFPSKIAPSLNIPDLQPKVTYCFSEGSSVLNGLTLSGLESFITEQELRLCGPVERKNGDAEQGCRPPGRDRKTPGKTRGTDTAVADVALNILCLLMKDQWSWLCTENIQKTIRLLFGTYIERWLDVGVAHLTSAPCWVIYLQVMQEAVWPEGILPAQSRPERSPAQIEETKEECLECLMQLVPEIITDMLGAEKYRLSLETMLDSLQDQHVNKHLVYCICDLLLEFLIPESFDEAFQRSLLHSLSKNVETLHT
ncbi:sorting nexin-19a [Lampris incognitus]|uniref:sorting nexin-19a n=1 Tax=Lampris incognitus TaxID=2546036 RepID=UPI0024B5E9E8|nr:sorting nexin-19a [Lampris incognitus]